MTPDSMAPTQPAVTGGPNDRTEPAEDQWVFLIDPKWTPEKEGDQPPIEAIVGGWLAEQDGAKSAFRANPEYQPSGPDAPTDPVDATIRLITQGKAEPDELMTVLRDAELAVAVDEDEAAVVVPAPDDVPSVLITTAPVNQRWVNGVTAWRETSALELAQALPAEGVDVLINPGAPASFRLLATVLKTAMATEPAAEEAAATAAATS